MTRRIVVGVTGASGSIYAYTLIEVLASMGFAVDVVLTNMGEKVLRYECGVGIDGFSSQVRLHAIDDLFSPLASGSYRTDGMVVVPCSMNTLGLLAAGTGEHLLARAAQVTLKERKPLVVVPREMPYNVIHLENMLRLARAGGIILPASPGFYHLPENMGDLIGHVVGRILDQFAIEHSLYKRWEGGA